jgi:putative oxidoreductase
LPDDQARPSPRRLSSRVAGLPRSAVVRNHPSGLITLVALRAVQKYAGYFPRCYKRVDAGSDQRMPLLRTIARPMLASIFIVEGYRTLRHPEQVVKQAEPVVSSLARFTDVVPEDTEQAVRINAAVQVGAGALLAAGWLPRSSALAIAATLVPTTAAGHRFWQEDDPERRGQQRIHFLKNLAMVGGLLIAAGDTAGKPSMAWRGRHGVKSARRELSSATRTAKVSARAGMKAGQVRGRLRSR